MKARSLATHLVWAVGALLAASFAFSGSGVPAAITNAALPAHLANDPLYQPKSDWGCEVLLCLSNPAGPTAVGECVPPINRLWDHLRRGRPFPRCTLSNGLDSARAGTWVQPAYNHYDRCPPGTTPLASGQFATDFTTSPPQQLYAGIGDGAGVEGDALPPLVCVGTLLDTQTYSRFNGEYFERVNVGRYDQVVALPPQLSATVFDVYIDNLLWHRVRW